MCLLHYIKLLDAEGVKQSLENLCMISLIEHLKMVVECFKANLIKIAWTLSLPFPSQSHKKTTTEEAF